MQLCVKIYSKLPGLAAKAKIDRLFTFMTADASVSLMLSFVNVLYCTVLGSRRLMPPDALQPKAYCANPGL